MRMRKFGFAASAAVLAVAVPNAARADDHMSSRDTAFAQAMADAFAAEPLTAEQETRVPAAVAVVDQVFPEGTYRRMMDESLKPMMGSLFGSTSALPVAIIGEAIGIAPDEVEVMGDTTIGEIMEIVDPVWQERSGLVSNLTLELMDGIVDQVEPPMRAGLARAYAVRFTDQQLAELSAFFATETGAYYAGESYIIFTDPQVMGAMQEMVPAMMEMVPELTRKMEERMAALPEMRSYTDLSEVERDRLASLLGLTREALEEKEGGFFSSPYPAETEFDGDDDSDG